MPRPSGEGPAIAKRFAADTGTDEQSLEAAHFIMILSRKACMDLWACNRDGVHMCRQQTELHLSPYRGPYSWLHMHGGDSRHGRIVQCLHFAGLLVYRKANLCSPVIGQSVMEGLEALKLTDSSRTPIGTEKAGGYSEGG